MKRARQLLAIGAASLVVMPGSARACDLAPRHDNPAQLIEHAREIFQRSTAIIDAEVIELTLIVPGRGVLPAHLRPIHILEGPSLPVFLVADGGCDIAFLRRGERVRVILTGGPDLFAASQEDHGMNYIDDGGGPLLAAVDVLIGAPLPPGFTRPGGEEPPPPPRERVTRRP